ncbi:MAG: flagellar motor switch protein FliN/FliY [Planctomycetota bacterium]|jgi:flagellar motor switch protein FliN/FliY
MTEETTEQQGDLETAIDDATEAVSVQASQLEELTATDGEGEPIGLDNLLDVPVRVTVQIGRASMSLGELVGLAPGSLVPLDREAHEPADILVNGKTVASGEVVTIDGSYGIRITRVMKD